jgi:hypothetical protein
LNAVVEGENRGKMNFIPKNQSRLELQNLPDTQAGRRMTNRFGEKFL